MAKACKVDVEDKVNGQEETIEELANGKVDPSVLGMVQETNDVYNKNQTLRTKDSREVKNFWDSAKEKIAYVKDIKYGVLDKTFERIKADGKREETNFTNIKISLQALNSDRNKTTQEEAGKINEVYSVHDYDENGNPIEGSVKPISEEKLTIAGNWQTAKRILELTYGESKHKLYFRNQYEDMLYKSQETMSKENYEAAKDGIEEHKISIQEDIELIMDRVKEARIKYLTKTKAMRLAKELQKSEPQFKDKNLKYIMDHLTFEQMYNVAEEAARDYQEDDQFYDKKRALAYNSALNQNYQKYLKYSIIPYLYQQINDDPQIVELVDKRVKHNDETFEELRQAQAEIGRDVSYLNKYEHYMKIMVQDIETGLNTEGATHSPLGVDLSMFVNMKGSTHEILTNLKLSDYLYNVGMAKNIHNAKVVKLLQKENVGKEVQDEILQEMELLKTDLNERILDKDSVVSDAEMKNMVGVINKFNNVYGMVDPNLAIDGENFRSERTFLNKNGIEVTGSINQEVENNIEIAIESTKNELKAKFQASEYQYFFEDDLLFDDVKRFLDGKSENIDIKRIYEFSKKINKSEDIYLDKSVTLQITDLVEMKHRLNSTLFDRNKKFVGQVIKKYTENGYVLTDQIGNKIGPNTDFRIGSMFMEDFDLNNPTAFAEWLAESIFIDADANNTIEFLRKDKIMIMPEPIADTLELMKNKLEEKHHKLFIEGLRKATTVAKLGMLFNPFRVITYNMRNAVYDTYAMLQSQPQALMELTSDLKSFALDKNKNPESPDIFTEFINYFLGRNVSDQFNEFMRYSETFMHLNESEIREVLGFNDNAASIEKEKELKELQNKIIEKYGLDVGSEKTRSRALKGASSLVVGYKYMTGALKIVMRGTTHVSQTREFFLRYAVYKSKSSEFKKLFEKEGEVKPRNWGAASKKVIRNLLEDGNAIKGNSEEAVAERNELYNKAAIKFANQSLVAYEDSSEFVDTISKWGIPFARFTEGNIRLHYRLLSNFISDIGETIKSGNLSTGQKAMRLSKLGAKGTLQAGNALGIPILAWNMAMLAMSGMDLDDIPEYYEEDGFVVMPPILKMMGHENIHLIGSADGVSDMMSIIGLEDLNTNIQNALASNFYALSNEDLETDLINDLSDAILSSFESPGEMFVMNPLEKAISMGNPLVKALPELLTGSDYYPEGPVNVGHRYNWKQNAVRKTLASVGLANLYTIGEQMAGMPRGMNAAELFGFKSVGSKLDAWNQQRTLAYQYAQDVLGKDPFSRTGYGDDVDYMREDIAAKLKYGKYEDAYESILEYIDYMKENTDSPEELEREMKNLQTSLKNRFSVIPSSAIAQKDLEEYVSTLSQKDINDLRLAYEYQREMLGPYYEWIFGN